MTMSRITVEVWVPAAGFSRDFSIPYEIRLYKTAALVIEILKDDENNDFTPGPDSVLCDGSSGSILDVNLTPEELGLETGSRIMLV